LVFVGFDFKFLVKERKMGKPSPHITVHHWLYLDQTSVLRL
jgi:hypothetical protein